MYSFSLGSGVQWGCSTLPTIFVHYLEEFPSPENGIQVPGLVLGLVSDFLVWLFMCFLFVGLQVLLWINYQGSDKSLWWELGLYKHFFTLKLQIPVPGLVSGLMVWFFDWFLMWANIQWFTFERSYHILIHPGSGFGVRPGFGLIVSCVCLVGFWALGFSSGSCFNSGCSL